MMSSCIIVGALVKKFICVLKMMFSLYQMVAILDFRAKMMSKSQNEMYRVYRSQISQQNIFARE